MLHLGGCSIWVATIALHEDHGRKADIMLVRALWSLDASSSPSVLRIVDLIATSERGDVAQNSEPSIAITTLQHFAARMTAGWPRRPTPDRAPALSNHSPL